MEGNVRKRICRYINDWVTFMYSRNWHNIVNQPHFNFFFKKECYSALRGSVSNSGAQGGGLKPHRKTIQCKGSGPS